MAPALRIAISGSYAKHVDRILDARAEFLSLGAEVLRPVNDEKIVDGEMTRMAGDPEDIAGIRRAQFEAIYSSDILYIVNPGGYVGPASTLDVGFAYSLQIPVWTSEPAFEDAVRVLVSNHGSPEELLGKEGK